MRRLALLVVVGALLIAGCNSAIGPNETNGTDGTVEGAVGGNATVGEPRPDPPTDRLGWEGGYWYDDPIAVNNTDGLNASEREALIARAKARVEQIRRLEFNASVNLTVRGRENATLAGGQPNATLQAFDNAKFEATFLVGEEEDSISVQDRSRNRTTGGYYNSRTKDIVIISDADTPRLSGERTLAHELVHALQDQHLNLSIRARAETRDGYNGILALIEGDASAVENEYMSRCGETWACLQSPGSEGSNASGGPPPSWGTYFLQFFPYSDGPDFVAALRDGDDWSRVNAAFENPPRSAQEVIDPATYGQFQAAEVALEDRTGSGWERVRPPGRPDYGRVGRSGLGAMFARTLYDESNSTALVRPDEFLNLENGQINRSDPLNYDLEATRGWTGDRLHVYRRGAELAYVWRLTWESSAAADRFADAYRRLLAYWGGDRVAEDVWVIDEGPFADAFRVTVEGSRVTVTNAPTRAELDEVRRP